MTPLKTKSINLISRIFDTLSVTGEMTSHGSGGIGIEGILPWFVLVNAGLEVIKSDGRIDYLSQELQENYIELESDEGAIKDLLESCNQKNPADKLCIKPQLASVALAEIEENIKGLHDHIVTLERMDVVQLSTDQKNPTNSSIDDLKSLHSKVIQYYQLRKAVEYKKFDVRQHEYKLIINTLKLTIALAAIITLTYPGLLIMSIYSIEACHEAYRYYNKLQMVRKQYETLAINQKSFGQLQKEVFWETFILPFLSLGNFLFRNKKAEITEEESSVTLALEQKYKARIYKLYCDAVLDIAIKLIALTITGLALTFGWEIIATVGLIVGVVTLALCGAMILYHAGSLMRKHFWGHSQKLTNQKTNIGNVDETGKQSVMDSDNRASENTPRNSAKYLDSAGTMFSHSRLSPLYTQEYGRQSADLVSTTGVHAGIGQ